VSRIHGTSLKMANKIVNNPSATCPRSCGREACRQDHAAPQEQQMCPSPRYPAGMTAAPPEPSRVMHLAEQAS
jgi:hypothetical protein